MSYEPETPFQISEDNRLVYNLYHRRLGPCDYDHNLSNDICVSIEARHMSERFQAEIAQVICNALNEKYPTEGGDK
jgi:hypothetical protein